MPLYLSPSALRSWREDSHLEWRHSTPIGSLQSMRVLAATAILPPYLYIAFANYRPIGPENGSADIGLVNSCRKIGALLLQGMAGIAAWRAVGQVTESMGWLTLAWLVQFNQELFAEIDRLYPSRLGQ